ncbi:MAG TPA: hypothetical protein VE422_41720 [Terriglobia bacterium]|nr:hypothetical protein [Terriglobia bacterium]
MDRQFWTLAVHFFSRFFDRDSASDDADPLQRMIQLLAMLSVPGLMLSFFLLPDHPSTPWVRITELDRTWLQISDHYVFVCYAFVVMGLVMTFKWDSLFPDRRDYLILTSLPISVRRLFAAKVVALCAFLLLFVVAINFFSMVLIPAVHPQMLAGHALGVLSASTFAALFFAGLQGVLINLLPPNAFRRISPSIQMVSIALLITVLLITPLVKESIRPLSQTKSPILDYFPFMWFLGIYESLIPSAEIIPQSSVWMGTALKAIGIVAVVFTLSYFVGYRRHSRKILESIEANDFAPGRLEILAKEALNRSILRNPFQRAAFYFMGKVSSRSARHRILTALYTGAGLALAMSSLFAIDRRLAFPFRISTVGVLEAPVILSFLVVSGLRATFNVPYQLEANWVFQTVDGGAGEYLKAIRKWVFFCRILPLYGLVALFEFAWFDRRTAAFHLIFDLVMTAFLTEAFFFSFNKVPFTCAYLRNRLHLALLSVGYLLGFTTYVSATGNLKRWVSADPLHIQRFLAFSAIVFGFILIYRWRSRGQTVKIVYAETDSVFQQLNLS